MYAHLLALKALTFASLLLTRPTPAFARTCSNPPLVPQPVFDPLLGSNANDYCPCSLVVFREQLNSSSGRCDDGIRNKSRNILRGIAEAGQYVSVAFVAAGCRDTVSVVRDMVQKSANSSQVLGLYNLPNASGASRNTSVAWGKVFREVGKTKNVAILDVSGMRGSDSRAAFGDNVGRLTNLQMMFVRNTDWRDPIPVAVGRLTQLRNLYVYDNPRMVVLPKGLLDGLGTLTHLMLSRNQLTAIPSLEKNTLLRLLNLQDNHLISIPSLEKNTALLTLRLQANHLTEILSLEKNTALSSLRLQNNRLTKIPSLEKNTALEWLDLENNHLTAIPSLEKNTALEYLDLQNNRLAAIPSLEKNTALNSLRLQNNHLTSIPSLGTNTMLSKLYLQNNRLAAIPSLEKNTALYLLYLQNNHLTSIPSLGTNTMLSELYLQNNRLAAIPSLEMNTALEVLEVENNHLTRIPSLKNTMVTWLLVANNSLQSSSAWPSPGHLPNSLEFLSVAQNQLVHIPTWVQQLPRLEYIDASTNNITSLDEKDSNIGTPGDAAVAVQGGLGRNASLLLVGGNPVCEYSVEQRSVWGSRWNVQCQSQCSSTCVVGIGWGSLSSWLGDGECDPGCNNAACGYDRGDCDIANNL